MSDCKHDKRLTVAAPFEWWGQDCPVCRIAELEALARLVVDDPVQINLQRLERALDEKNPPPRRGGTRPDRAGDEGSLREVTTTDVSM